MQFQTTQVQETLGLRYANIRKIGAGGMACVFSAHDSVLDRAVAVKLVSSQVAADELIVRFQQEAKLASRLKHPAIVTVLDFGRGANGVLYLIMDLVDGASMAQVLKESGGKLTLNQTLGILVQVCDALAHAHGQGVVHRDIKPSNIMLMDNGTAVPDVRIVDFGLAKVVSEDLKLTRTGQAICTPLYASPEQVSAKPIDQRTDIYSVGCVLYHALTGKPPFVGASQLETYNLHLNAPVPSIRENGYTGEKADELQHIIETALRKDRNERYANFYQLKSDLIKLLPEESRMLIQDAAEKYAQNQFRSKSFFTQHKFAIAGTALCIAVLGSMALNTENKHKPTVHSKPGKLFNNSSGQASDQSEWQFVSREKHGIKTYTNIDCRMSDPHFEMLQGKDVQAIVLYAMRLNGSGLKYLRDEPLERLEMAESKIDDKHISPLGQLKKLKVLNISYTWLSDKGLETIDELPNLIELQISGCQKMTSKAVDSLLKIAPKVERLEIGFTPIGKAGYEKLVGFKNLASLDVSYSDLTDDMVQPILKLKLRDLSIAKNPRLTDATLKQLAKNRSIDNLKIFGCKFSNEAVADFKKARPHCKVAVEDRKPPKVEDLPF